MAPNASRAVPARTPAPAPAPRPADKRPHPGGSPGGQREATWEQFARSVERLAGQLGALADDLPAGEPGDKEAKSLRRSVGRLSEGLGKLKRAPRSGLPG